jgi:hypothetical protein
MDDHVEIMTTLVAHEILGADYHDQVRNLVHRHGMTEDEAKTFFNVMCCDVDELAGKVKRLIAEATS